MNPWDMAFLGVFALYLVYAVALNRRRDEEPNSRSSPASFLLQTPLFLLACRYGWEHGAFTRAWIFPPAILGGIALGHLTFGLSFYLTHLDARDALHHLASPRPIGRFLADNPNPLFRFLGVSVSEELIYRAAAQPLLIGLLGHPVSGIAAVALAFAAVHWHFFRNPVLQSIEFVGFSVLLGALYYATGSVVLVVMVHTVRNLEIVYLEYRIKLEELGDADAAAQALEAGYSRQPGQIA